MAESDYFLFIHLAMQWIFIGTYYVPGIVLGAGDTELNETNGIPYIEGEGAE